nr:MAG TPA: hypothetical protein [Caudoviricetes sp.]
MGRNATIELVDVNGQMWRLNDPASPVRIVRGGLGELSSRAVATTRAGEVVPGGSKLTPVTTSLTVGFYPAPGVELGEVRRAFRAGWANDDYCRLQVTPNDGMAATARLRLPDDTGLPPREVLTPNLFDTLQVPVYWYDGCWLSYMVGEGRTEVRNTGVSRVKVWIRWQQGGTVTLPSRRTFELPTVPEPRRVLLDRAKGFPVTTVAGEPDRELTRELWGQVVEERIMPRSSGVFTPPPGGRVEWEIGVREP